MTATPPAVADVLEWLGAQGATVAPDLVADALDVALEAQAAVCVVDPYTVNLRYAALRRTARVLAARPHALGTIDGGEFGSFRVSRWDVEIQAAESDALVGGFG